MTIPHIIIEQIKALYQGYDERSYQHFLAADNSLIDAYNEKQAQQESEYITAAQARELGAGAEWLNPFTKEWRICVKDLRYLETMSNDGKNVIKYRAIKQAQSEPVIVALEENNAQIDKKLEGFHNDESFSTELQELAEKAIAKLEAEPVGPHATLRAEYIRQRDAVPCELGFYLWEHSGNGSDWIETPKPDFTDTLYRCTDISCTVSKDGESAIRMLRTEAQELQRKLGDAVDWTHNNNAVAFTHKSNFRDCRGIYTYRTKATIKLDDNMVTPEQAAAEWDAKKETHDVWASFRGDDYLKVIYAGFLLADYPATYELRLKPAKQPTWTGSREDAIALLKELGVL